MSSSFQPGQLSNRVRIVVATSVMLTFISYWRAAAIVLNDLGSSAFYAAGIAEQAVGKSAPWFILAVMLFSFAVRAVYVESCSMFVRGGVYRIVKESRPEIQLAMLGAMAGDDPEAWGILDQINAEAADDPDLYVFTNLTGIGSMEVNAFQRAADVVLQKSLREGFGLVVAEAFWKSRPVVAGHAGGIPMQFPAGYDDYLVESVEDCAAKTLRLLENRELAERFGRAGQEKIRAEFLLPRLIRDELRLIKDVLR